MQVRNPYNGTEPLQCLCITATGEQYPMSCISTPLIDVRDNVTEMVTRWVGNGYDHTKVWTADMGWMEMSEYQVRKQLQEDRRQLEEEQRKFKARKERAQLAVKETPHEDDPTPELEQ